MIRSTSGFIQGSTEVDGHDVLLAIQPLLIMPASPALRAVIHNQVRIVITLGLGIMSMQVQTAIVVIGQCK